MPTGFPSIDTSATPKMRQLAWDIAGRLRVSGRHWKSDELEAEFGVKDVAIRAAVGWARRQGDPMISKIAADETGYWWAETKADALQTLQSLSERAGAIEAARRGMASCYPEPMQEGLL